MPNYKQAPKLCHNKGKYDDGKNFYKLPYRIMNVIFNELSGQCGNQIKLMCVLLGTIGDGSWGVSEKWVQERTGMVEQTYNAARKALINRGWLKLEDGKLYVLVDEIMKNEGTM